MNESPCMSAARTKFQWWIWWRIHNFTCGYDRSVSGAVTSLCRILKKTFSYKEPRVGSAKQWTKTQCLRKITENRISLQASSFTSGMTWFRYLNLKLNSSRNQKSAEWTRVLGISARRMACFKVDNFDTTTLRVLIVSVLMSKLEILLVYNCEYRTRLHHRTITKNLWLAVSVLILLHVLQLYGRQS